MNPNCRRRIFAALAVAAAVLLVASSATGQARRRSTRARRTAAKSRSVRPVNDFKSLVARLRAGGARVEATDDLTEQPFFTGVGRTLLIGGGGVQTFEYRDAAAAETEARRISPDGSGTETSKIAWIAPPHFFRSGRIIVLYFGDDVKIVRVLTDALGKQFAGR
ncbi:MAG: hypothetical protein ABR554_06855 [Pyrinomonadaceae bacterium]